MDGLLIVGHGSLQPHSSVGMQRVARKIAGSVRHLEVEAGFLNFGRPTLGDCAAALVKKGVKRVAVQPYFLTTGQYVTQELDEEIRKLRGIYPDLPWHLKPVLGEHPNVHAMLRFQLEKWRRSLASTKAAGVVLVAHGSHFDQSVQQVLKAADRLREEYTSVPTVACFLEINSPDLATGCWKLLRNGIFDLAVLPYFLHLGRHVKVDLPSILATVTEEYPRSAVQLLAPLDDSQQISEIILSHISPPLVPAAQG